LNLKKNTKRDQNDPKFGNIDTYTYESDNEVEDYGFNARKYLQLVKDYNAQTIAENYCLKMQGENTLASAKNHYDLDDINFINNLVKLEIERTKDDNDKKSVPSYMLDTKFFHRKLDYTVLTISNLILVNKYITQNDKYLYNYCSLKSLKNTYFTL